MPLPDNVQTGTVIGRFISLKDGTPMQGTVTFAPTLIKALDATADDPGPVTLVPEEVNAALDSNGAFSVALAATDDPQLNPHGTWNYKVTHEFGYGVEVPSFFIDVPQGTTIDLTLVSPAEQGGGAILVQGIPTGGSPGQFLAKNSPADYDTEWVDPPAGGGGGGGTWGSITGTLASQTDLQTALNGKAAASHTHTAANVSDFSEAVDDRVNGLLVAGTNVSLAYNDVANTLTINAAGGGGGGAVDSVNGQTGVVELDAADVGARPDSYVPAWSDITSKPAVIAAGADATTARGAIGAGTSNLAIGSTGSTAMAGNKTAADLGGLVSNPTGITGATAFANIVKISDADYAALPTKDPATLYVRIAG